MDLLFERGSSKHEYDLLSAYDASLQAFFHMDLLEIGLCYDKKGSDEEGQKSCQSFWVTAIGFKADDSVAFADAPFVWANVFFFAELLVLHIWN